MINTKQGKKNKQALHKEQIVPTAQKVINNSKAKVRPDPADDERFREVYSDPRYMQVPKKVRKVEIDDRFKKAITSKEFNLVTKVDKYGRKIAKEDNTMKKFYNLETDKKSAKKTWTKQESEEEQLEGSEQQEDDSEHGEDQVASKKQKGKKYYDEEGKFKWNVESSSEENEEEEDDQSSDSAEDAEGEQAQSAEEEDSIWSEGHEESREDKGDENEVQIGKRLALINMDWDNITAVDILALFSSLCKGDMLVTKVEIFPSLFGLEQMKRDSLYGPPKEMLENLPKNTKRKREVEDDEFLDDEQDFGFNSQQLRKYEFQKMRYYYAVIHCNNKTTSSKLYDEYNGFEFELSNIRLNLSFIADDLTFQQKVKEQATEVPADYEFKAAQSISKALNHTNVKITWDQTDPKRIQKMIQIMEKAESDDDDDERYKEFLASASEDEEDGKPSRDKIEEYRQKLLGALSGGDGDDTYRKRDLQTGDANEERELDIKFNVGFGEDLGKKAIKDKEVKKERETESEWQKYQRKRKEKKREKKQLAKDKAKTAKIEIFEEEDEDTEKKKAQLEMLVGKTRKERDLKGDVSDTRFGAVLKDKEYALDPTHKNFRKVADGEFFQEQQAKRRKLHE